MIKKNILSCTFLLLSTDENINAERFSILTGSVQVSYFLKAGASRKYRGTFSNLSRKQSRLLAHLQHEKMAPHGAHFYICGGGEIRTLETLSSLLPFQGSALDHYATPPSSEQFIIVLAFSLHQCILPYIPLDFKISSTISIS